MRDRVVNVRARTDADLPRCEQLVRLVHEVDGYPPRLARDLRSFISSPDAVGTWVAERSGEIVGHVALHSTSSPEVVALACERTGRPPDGLGVVARLLVAPENRRAGIGTALLGAAAGAAWARCLWPVLDVATHFHAATTLYERRGWVRAGTVTVSIGDSEPLDEFIYLAPPPDRT